MKIYIGCDDNGRDLKEILINELVSINIECVDYNKLFSSKDELYPDVAVGVCNLVLHGSEARGILICGTGLGMCISANKVPGIRAAVCHDPYSTERSIKSNDVQIMCMGSHVIGDELARNLLHIWVGSESGIDERSVPKVERINFYDEMYRKK